MYGVKESAFYLNVALVYPFMLCVESYTKVFSYQREFYVALPFLINGNILSTRQDSREKYKGRLSGAV